MRNSIMKNRIKSSSGFTMMEMMIIVVIVGLLAAIAVPSFFRAMPRLRAKSEARTILNQMRTARSAAISEGVQVGVYYDDSIGAVFMFKDMINPLDYMYEEGEQIVGQAHRLDVNVQIIDNSFSRNAVVFLPDGSASQSGSLTVIAGENGPSYSVSIIGATGKPKLSSRERIVTNSCISLIDNSGT